jgi:hypothetical protein
MKGFFKPKNPQKYKGDLSLITFRSSWELKVMCYLDTNDNILEWSSEEVVIPYLSPIDGRYHRYFPDFLVKKRNPNGTIKMVLIEVKPNKQTKPPTKPASKKISKQYINEVKTWGINKSKWEYAEKYCKERNWDFLILTEKELGIKF